MKKALMIIFGLCLSIGIVCAQEDSNAKSLTKEYAYQASEADSKNSSQPKDAWAYFNQGTANGRVGNYKQAILDAVKNPVEIVNQAKGAVKYIGENATVILNRAGEVITTWARNSLGWRIRR
jgi:hypothetical protein